MKKALVLFLLLAVGPLFVIPSQGQVSSAGTISGNFQIDAQYYIPDSLIDADTIAEKALFNGWGNVIYSRNLQKGTFSAGIRYESYLNRLNGYPAGFSGTGIPYRYATFNSQGLEITAGSSYEQFGSGLVLRIYEDRGLGYDNALDGIRVRATPYRGIYLKGLWGKQRNGMTSGPGIVRGFDGEININQLIGHRMDSVKTQFIAGGNFVSKFQADLDPFLNLPQNVGAWSGRMNIIRKRINFYAEYAYKINDPSSDNDFIYKPGQAIFSSLTYSRKGLGIYLGYLHVDNFSYRSDRNASINSLLINYIPALTKQHVYALVAYYPFASIPKGQVSLQGQVDYKVKKGSVLGGKYGMDITLNYAKTNALDTTTLHDEATTRQGYSINSYLFGDSAIFEDLNIEIFRKFNSKFKMTFVYAFIKYNKNVLLGKFGYPMIPSHSVVFEPVYKLNNKITLKADIEHMYTKEDYGSWAMWLQEVDIGQNFFFVLMDQWNYGNEDPKHRIHYYTVKAGYYWATHRIEVGYGKQRQGVFCVGGVCRLVPASNGFTLTITSSF
ncbi:MAG TPA: DUF6029 family protein [Bacteroidia bacterium]|nr:DUF6029 family protein [Bacteroidia bacterium]